MSKCPGCQKSRDLREPCSHCGAGPTAVPTPQALSFEELQPTDAKRPPKPQEALKRYSTVMDESPLFAAEPDADLVIVQPIDATHPLHVTIEAKFEVASAPADA